MTGKPSHRTRATARDVADLAGVSPSTVSRVLSGTTGHMISEATKNRVREVASSLGYSPHPLARALRGKGLRLLGVIVREIADPFFASFVSELGIQARELNYHLVLGHAQSDPEEALEMTAVLDTRQADGVFLLGDLRDDEAALETILGGGCPVIALCRGPSPASVFTINTDNYIGTYKLLDHLYELGHRRIGFIDGGWLGDIRERREAFLKYVRERALTFLPEWIQTETNGARGGYRAMSRLLDLPARPTAIFAADDTMAIGAIKAVTDAGLSVPGDMSVAGFDDIELTEYFCPAVTTIQQPVKEMIRQALRLMAKLIGGEDMSLEETVIRIAPELIVRQSTGRAAPV